MGVLENLTAACKLVEAGSIDLQSVGGFLDAGAAYGSDAVAAIDDLVAHVIGGLEVEEFKTTLQQLRSATVGLSATDAVEVASGENGLLHQLVDALCNVQAALDAEEAGCHGDA